MTQTVTPSPASDAASEHTATSSTASPMTRTMVLDVEGMMCAGCVSTVEKKLAQCEGVKQATVNLVTEVAAVEYAVETDPVAIAQTLTQAGYPSKIRTPHSAPLAAEADWLARKEAAQQNQTRNLIVAAVLLTLSTLGHLEHFGWTSGLSIPILSPLFLSRLWFHAALATLTLLFPARQIMVEGLQGLRRASPNMNTLVGLGALSAYGTSVAALLFPGLGWACFFDEPVMLLSFILLGRTLEQRARFQAASSLRSLIALQPTLARLVPAPDTAHNKTQAAETPGIEIPASEVPVGEWLKVLPSEKVPVDGTIAAGQTTVDESMLSGESMPVVKRVGDEVVAGSLNQSGAITIQVTRTGDETALAQMIHLVETAQTRKAPIQGFADLVAGYFTYGVLACALLTFCFWYFIGVPTWPDAAQVAMGHAHHGAGMHSMAADTVTGPIAGPIAGPPADTVADTMATGSGVKTEHLRLLASLKLAIAVLVVACPCALGLATPTAILVGSGVGAKRGLLIRGGDILEAARGLDTVVFDKTGTLTTGNPQLTDCLVVDSAFSSDQILQLAATVESGTRHPLGVAIEQAATKQNQPLLKADEFYTEAGFGAAANVTPASAQSDCDTIRCLVGNSAWMSQNGCSLTGTQDAAQRLGKAGKTAVFVSVDAKIVGILGVADTLREDAASTVSDLRSLGLDVHIVSGDSAAAANAIAQQLSLPSSNIQAEVTPQGKVEAISTLQNRGHRVGLVGDGINDAPAIAQADVGIALNSGTDVAMETADIVLMRDALSDVPASLKLSQATFNKIRQNLAWAFAYNLICIPLAAGAFLPAFGLSLNPGFAGGLMALSSVTVVVNSLLLKRQ